MCLLIATACVVLSSPAHGAQSAQPAQADKAIKILEAVSCVSADFCAAVGNYDTPQDDTPDLSRNLAMLWDGTRWRQIHVPAGRAINQPALSDVSCTSTKFCMAVGTDEDQSFRSFSAKWNGTSWSTVPDSPRHFGLERIDCASRNMCISVGEVNRGESSSRP